MQRFICILYILTFVLVAEAFGDTIHLKDGTIITGTITEEVLGETITIRTPNGIIYTFALADISKITRQQITRQKITTRKEPALSCILSIIIPGAGQVYNEEYGKGLFFFLGSSIGLGIAVSAMRRDIFGQYHVIEGKEDIAAAGALLWFFNHIISIIEAPISAHQINKKNEQHTHLIQFDKEQFTVGLDPIIPNQGWGGTISLRF